MPFPRKLLNDGEDVVLDLRPHWWFLAGPVAALVAFIVLSIVVQTAFEPPDAVTLAMLVIGVVMMIWFLVRYAKWSTTNFVSASSFGQRTRVGGGPAARNSSGATMSGSSA